MLICRFGVRGHRPRFGCEQGGTHKSVFVRASTRLAGWVLTHQQRVTCRRWVKTHPTMLVGATQLLLTSLCITGAALAGPLTPDEALRAFQLADDRLTIELVASEPAIEDPVGMAFDEDGRLYVVEMRGFQQGPDAKGIPGVGRVTMLEDRDGDGRFEHHTVFAGDMYYPTAVMPAYGGLLVGCAPDILFFKDTDGDGRADVRKVLFTGFGRKNHEQLLNSFQWGLDNWVHVASGGAGGDIRPIDPPDVAAVEIGNRNLRFRFKPPDCRSRLPGGTGPARQAGPTEAATFELLSGGGQFGLTATDWDDWFTCNNPSHIRHYVLRDEYLRRNPYLAASDVLLNIPDHEPAARIYRISPLEEWRVVRTRQRAATMASKYPASELEPGGYFTASCGINIYRGDNLPREYYGDSFTCDAANNLIHRDRLVPSGVTFVAQRTSDEEKDFLASKDNWFRPITTVNGPDGAMYVVDMYRQIIETPDSIPADILKTIDMSAGKNQGRIYRIRPKGEPYSRSPLALSRASAAELVPLLGHVNVWQRMTAQRLLVERKDSSAVEPLKALVSSKNPLARLHAMYTLDGLGALTAEEVRAALNDPEPHIREHGLRLAERDEIRGLLIDTVLGLVNDPSVRVRFQLASTLGFIDGPRALAALAQIAQQDAGDEWIRTAVLSSVGRQPSGLWRALHQSPCQLFEHSSPEAIAWARELMAVVGAQAADVELTAALDVIASGKGSDDAWWQEAALKGLAEGIERSGAAKKLSTRSSASPWMVKVLLLTDSTIPTVRISARHLASRLTWAPTPVLDLQMKRDEAIALDSSADLEERISAIEFLSADPSHRLTMPPTGLKLLSPDQPAEIQKAFVNSLVRTHVAAEVQALLARKRWQGYTPAVRDAVLAAVFRLPEYLPLLLSAIEAGDVPAWALSAGQQKRLLEHKDATIRSKAASLLSKTAGADRQAVYERYKKSLDPPGDADRGKLVFKTHCAACHQLEGMGSVVGPDLKGVRDREPAALLSEIIMPSQSLTAGYSYYIIDTEDGESLDGVIAGESASAVTLRQREGVEQTVLRSNIKSLYASSISMMPEDLEKTIDPRQMADLIAYLKAQK